MTLVKRNVFNITCRCIIRNSLIKIKHGCHHRSITIIVQIIIVNEEFRLQKEKMLSYG